MIFLSPSRIARWMTLNPSGPAAPCATHGLSLGIPYGRHQDAWRVLHLGFCAWDALRVSTLQLKEPLTAQQFDQLVEVAARSGAAETVQPLHPREVGDISGSNNKQAQYVR